MYICIIALRVLFVLFTLLVCYLTYTTPLLLSFIKSCLSVKSCSPLFTTLVLMEIGFRVPWIRKKKAAWEEITLRMCISIENFTIGGGALVKTGTYFTALGGWVWMNNFVPYKPIICDMVNDLLWCYRFFFIHVLKEWHICFVMKWLVVMLFFLSMYWRTDTFVL